MITIQATWSTKTNNFEVKYSHIDTTIKELDMLLITKIAECVFLTMSDARYEQIKTHENFLGEGHLVFEFDFNEKIEPITEINNFVKAVNSGVKFKTKKNYTDNELFILIHSINRIIEEETEEEELA